METLLGIVDKVSLVEISALCSDCPIDELVQQVSDVLPNTNVRALREVLVDGIPLYSSLDSDGLSRFRSEYFGFVFQVFNLISYMTFEENVMLPLAHKPLSRTVKKSMALSILDKVGLGDRTNHLPSELSGGPQQTAGIARALVNEPTGNLDSKTRDDILNLFKELNSWGHTIIMVTHDDSSIKVASRSIKLLDGNVHK